MTQSRQHLAAIGFSLSFAVAPILALLPQACSPATLAAVGPLLAAGEQGIAAIVTAEAQRAGVPPSDPAYQVALAAAQALEAEGADAGAQLQRRLDAILLELRRARPTCPAVPEAGTLPGAVRILPAAPAVLPVVDGAAVTPEGGL